MYMDDIRKQWIEITGRKDWIPTKSSTICSQHFNEDDFEVKNSKKRYLKNGAVPHVQVVYIVNDTKDSTLSSRKRTQKNIGNEIINKRAKVQEIVDPILTTSSTVTVMEESASQTIRDVDPVPLNSSTVFMEESVNQPIKDIDPVPTNSSVLMEECSSIAIQVTTDYVKKFQSSVPSFIDSNASTPRKRRLTRITSSKENIIKHQRNQIKRIQAQNRRLKKKIHKMADIINDLEKKFSLKEEQKIICVKRIMRKLKNDAGRSLMQPMGTVVITFASNVLPDHVDLYGWRFVLNQYITPVKQCYNCLSGVWPLSKVL
ncbi:unnamed protein product [Parnassius apollo]|uniref:(apollo) hypothetical protein n=1 Tax=Parnassius apollo TaxID=110799 RepID=A0A8S3WED7_PARAO|nr:unnamed protein product [Parnassius apollo]